MLRKIKNFATELYLSLTDPRRLKEMHGERSVLEGARELGYFEGLEGARILEIGPKHGQDTRILAALKPRELVLIDLPEKRELVNKWLATIPGNVRYIEANLLFLSQEEIKALGQFDFILCAGVLYHNAEQLRLLRRLFSLASIQGRVLIESATTRNPALRDLNVVELHWPRQYRDNRTISHLPSRLAIKSWLEMVGFENVAVEDVYSKHYAHQRAVLSGKKLRENAGYAGYSPESNHQVYLAGNAS